MRQFFTPCRRKLGVVTLVMACVFAVGWVKSFVVESRPLNTDRQGEDDAIVGSGSDNTPVDRTKYEQVLIERDPTTGSRFFSVNGSPVQGKLKAYLEDPATWEEGDMLGIKNNPDGETSTWVMIPTPLFLSLTDQSPSP